MHIAFLYDSAPTGQADARLVGLLEAMAQTGDKASLVVGAGTPSDDANRLVERRCLIVPVSADMSAATALALADRVARFSEEHLIDVLHLFSGLSVIIGVLAVERLNRPYVVALDAPIESAANSSASWLLLEHALIGAKRVFCSRGEVARAVLHTTPSAECRPFPSEPLAGSNGTIVTWGAYLAETFRRDGQPVRLDAPQRLRRMFEDHPNLPICSNDMARALVSTLQTEASVARDRLAHLAQARSFESDKHDQALGRLRQRLEMTDQRLTATLGELGSARTELDRLNAELVDRDRLLRTSTAQAEDRQRQLEIRDRELAEIKTSTGWALLLFLWSLRRRFVPHGGRRDRSLWALLSTYRALRHGGLAGLASASARGAARTSAARRLLDGAPTPLRNWLDDRVWSTSNRSLALAPPSVEGTALSSPASDNPVLTVGAQPNPTKYDVIVFPVIDWAFRFQRPQQLASKFADAGHRVFYLATTFTEGSAPVLKPIRQGVVEVQLPGPGNVSPYTDDLGPRATELAHALGHVRGQFNIADAVCLVNLPFWTSVVLQLRELFGWKVVYDCLDDYAGFTNTSRRMLRAEETLSRQSDLVTVTSHELLAKHSSLNPSCELMPNASDFLHFRFSTFAPPEDLAELRPGHPVIGYYGAIADWFDSTLIGNLALARPEWEFVLIGSTFTSDLRPLRDRPNIHLLGEKPYVDLPPYLHAFDVAIIPFKKLPLTEATNPVKLFEYASAGKPIVATDLSELRNYSEYVTLATGVPGWLAALEAALAPMDQAAALQRVEFARRNSWSQRLAQAEDLIAPLFPLASIIIVTYNNLDYTRLCLDSIFSKTAYPAFEVIVVDNGSTDGTETFLNEFALAHHDMRVILNGTNYGFAKANNIGVGVAKGEYVVFLNNDTVVTATWLSRLVYYLRNPRVGMVGPVTNWSGNESRIQVAYKTISSMETFAQAYTRDRVGMTFELDMAALFCVAMRRSTIEEVGLLDERFGIGMFEDDDYALRVKQRGYTIICAEDVFVHHWGRASFSRLDNEHYHNLFEENRRKFETKWATAWVPHRSRAEL